jgi:hypothetical protein
MVRLQQGRGPGPGENPPSIKEQEEVLAKYGPLLLPLLTTWLKDLRQARETDFIKGFNQRGMCCCQVNQATYAKTCCGGVVCEGCSQRPCGICRATSGAVKIRFASALTPTQQQQQQVLDEQEAAREAAVSARSESSRQQHQEAAKARAYLENRVVGAQQEEADASHACNGLPADQQDVES